jgi:hypothetical protein
VNLTLAIEWVIQKIPTIITHEHNEALMTQITQAEVDQANQELPTGKALGPYGFTTIFFHSLLAAKPIFFL